MLSGVVVRGVMGNCDVFLVIIGIMNHDRKWDLKGLMDQLVKRAMATEPIQIQIQLQLQLQIHNYRW